MEVTKQESDNLTTLLKVQLAVEDYQPKFNKELKKHREKAQMKGFRKGKTPMSVIKKMYGQSILADVVMNTINTALTDYIQTEKLDVLGQPLPSEDQVRYTFDPNQLEEMEFVFDIGVAGDFDIVGLDDVHDIYKVEVPESIVDEEIMVARRRFGNQVEAEGNIEDKDILTIKASELEGEAKKEDGWETGFTLMPESISDEDLKKKIIGSDLGVEFTFDIYNLESGKDDKYVKKYLLNLDEEEEKEIGNMFTGKVEKIMKLVPAEMDEAFFKKYFGNEEVKTEDEAREKVKEEISKYYENQTALVMNRKVMETLMEKTGVTIPDDFMKRWLKESNENLTDENLEDEYPAFVQNLKWTLIKNKLSVKYDIKVDQNDVMAEARKKVIGYMQGYPMDEKSLNDMAQRLLSNKEQVNKIYEEVEANKIFEALQADLSLSEVAISLEKFKDVVKNLNESLAN